MYQRLTTPLLLERNTKRCGAIRSQMPYVSASKDGTPVTWRDALALANTRKEMGACNNGLTRSPRGHDAIWVIVDRVTKTTHFLPYKISNTLTSLSHL